MEFKEFSNPLEEDYDITSSLNSEEDRKEDSIGKENNTLAEKYPNPTRKTINEVKKSLDIKPKSR